MSKTGNGQGQMYDACRSDNESIFCQEQTSVVEWLTSLVFNLLTPTDVVMHLTVLHQNLWYSLRTSPDVTLTNYRYMETSSFLYDTGSMWELYDERLINVKEKHVISTL